MSVLSKLQNLRCKLLEEEEVIIQVQSQSAECTESPSKPVTIETVSAPVPIMLAKSDTSVTSPGRPVVTPDVPNVDSLGKVAKSPNRTVAMETENTENSDLKFQNFHPSWPYAAWYFGCP